eukprot:COSAG04_NODE_5102_length_1737_cov_1.065934_2_plen_139_part_01
MAAPGAGAGKASKRQHYRKIQRRQQQRDGAKALRKIATASARALLRALKKAKQFELAKAARRIKAVAQEGGDAAEITARREAVKTIGVPELLAAAVEKHSLQLLLEHNADAELRGSNGETAADVVSDAFPAGEQPGVLL